MSAADRRPARLGRSAGGAHRYTRLPARLPPAWTCAIWTVAAAALVSAVLVGGTAPEPAPFGLPDAGAFTGWGLPVARLVGDLAAAALVGFLLLPAVLLDEDGPLTATTARSARIAAGAAGVLAVAVAVQLVLGASTLVAEPVFGGLAAGDVGEFLLHTPQGWACGAQLLLSAALVPVIRSRRTAAGLWWVLVTALPIIAFPALVGHAVTTRQHTVAAAALVGHLVAAALWAGGLAALVWLGGHEPEALPAAVTRYSGLALRCAVAVGVSGPLTALLHAGIPSGSYGALVWMKTLAFASLVACGWAHRRTTLPRLGHARGPFVRLAVVELLVMAAAFGFAVALSRTPTVG